MNFTPTEHCLGNIDEELTLRKTISQWEHDYTNKLVDVSLKHKLFKISIYPDFNIESDYRIAKIITNNLICLKEECILNNNNYYEVLDMYDNTNLEKAKDLSFVYFGQVYKVSIQDLNNNPYRYVNPYYLRQFKKHFQMSFPRPEGNNLVGVYGIGICYIEDKFQNSYIKNTQYMMGEYYDFCLDGYGIINMSYEHNHIGTLKYQGIFIGQIEQGLPSNQCKFYKNFNYNVYDTNKNKIYQGPYIFVDYLADDTKRTYKYSYIDISEYFYIPKELYDE